MNAISALLQKWYPRYDVVFGEGIDPSTGRFIMKRSPAGGASAPRVIFYTPSGSNTGPTNTTIDGVACVVYTRILLSGCSALVRSTTFNFFGQATSGTPFGDWVLFPAGTNTFPLNGETAYGNVNQQSGISLRYPTVFGSYDPTDANYLTSSANWNKKLCIFDLSAIRYKISNNGFFWGSHQGEQNIAFLNLCVKANPTTAALFYKATNIKRGILMERCVTDGAIIDIEVGNTSANFYPNNAPISSLTFTGTTATAVTNSTMIASMNWALNAYPTPQACVVVINAATGADAALYNGRHVVTSVNTGTNSFTYTMAGTPASNPTGSSTVGLKCDEYAEVFSCTDIVFNQCGLGYGAYANGAHSFNIFLAGPMKRVRMYQCVSNHGGWGRGATRSSAPYIPTAALLPITGSTITGASCTFQTPNTGSIAPGGYVILAHTYSGFANALDFIAPVTAVVANTSITIGIDANFAAANLGGASINASISGNTLTVNSVAGAPVAIGQQLVGAGVTTATITAGSGTTWTINGSAQTVSAQAMTTCPTWQDTSTNGYDGNAGDTPDQFSHSVYFDSTLFDIKIYDMVVMNDCCNAKLTGGPYYIENWVDIRNPGSIIFAPFGNDAVGVTWMSGASIVLKDHLQIFSDDCCSSGLQAWPLSWAPHFKTASAGTTYSNGLVLNATNPSGTSRSGLTPETVATAYQSVQSMYYFDVRHSITSGWGVDNDATATPFMTKTYQHNITDDSTVLPDTVIPSGVSVPNASNLSVSATPSAFQTKLTATKALNIANTFRLATLELAGVTVAGDGSGTDMATEKNIFDYMLYHPEVAWAAKLQAHFRQPIGR